MKIETLEDVINKYFIFNPTDQLEIIIIDDNTLLCYGIITTRFLDEFPFQGGLVDVYRRRVQNLKCVDREINVKKQNFGYFTFKLNFKSS